MCRKRGQSLRLNIAVIDNGVNRELLEILLPHKKDTVDCRQISDGTCVPQFLEPEGDLESHGTLCAALLMEFLEKNHAADCRIFSVSILNRNRGQELGEFCAALEWCVAKKMDVVLMSIGVKIPAYAKRLLPFLDRAKNQGTILLAAASNSFEITYPACYKDAIGIKKGCCYGIKAIWEPKDGIDLEGNFESSCVMDRYSQWIGEPYGVSNSFALPYIAASICFLLQQYGKMGKRDLVRCFSEKEGIGHEAFINPAVLIAKGRNLPPASYMEEPIPKIAVIYQECAGKNLKSALEDIMLRFEEKGYSCICAADWEKKNDFEKNIFPLSYDKIQDEVQRYSLYFRNNSLIIFFAKQHKTEPEFIVQMDQTIVLEDKEDRNLADWIVQKILQQMRC